MNARKIAAFAVGPLGGAMIGLVTVPVVTWVYPAEDVGRIAMLQVALSFFVLVCSLGLDQAYVREYHEHTQQSKLLVNSIVPGLVLLVIVIAGLLARPEFISAKLFDIDESALSMLVGICAVAAFVSRFLSLMLRMQEKGIAYSFSQLLPKLIFLSLILTYVALGFGFDTFHLILAHTISLVLVMFLYAWSTKADIISAFRAKVEWMEVKKLLDYGAPLILGGAAFWVLTTIDKVFLKNFSTFEQLGLYSVATSFAAVAIVFQSIFSTVWVPVVYRWVSDGVAGEKIDQVTETILLAVVVIFVAAGLLSWLVSVVLPDSYSSVQYILVACMGYPLFYTLSETTVIGINIVKKSAYSMLAAVLATVVNALGNFWLVPLYGAKGAAVSLAVAFWFFMFFRTEFSCFLWRQLPRLKLYLVSLACLVGSILHAFYGKDSAIEIAIMWTSLGGGAILFFRNVITNIYRYLSKCRIGRSS